eukprot:1607673-Rhodomonas_salina.1
MPDLVRGRPAADLRPQPRGVPLVHDGGPCCSAIRPRCRNHAPSKQGVEARICENPATRCHVHLDVRSSVTLVSETRAFLLGHRSYPDHVHNCGQYHHAHSGKALG